LSEVHALADAPDALEALLVEVHARGDVHPEAWITRASLASVRASLRAASERKARGETLPLYGVPFAVKDNIDVAGTPTTAACPAFAYVPEASSPVVDRLLDAGAIFMGKTNLDQFATGLTGARSPYGTCKNPFDPAYISGGSSSGSGVVVAAGLACFSLGTDTAGSGRVPAGLMNIVGLKPTRGLLSIRGVVPACRSLDCVTLFAATVADAERLLPVCEGFDALDPFSRRAPTLVAPRAASAPRIGVPQQSQLEFFGDTDAANLYSRSLERFRKLGASVVNIDLAPFLEAAQLLYHGPWLAERLQATGELLRTQPDALLPVIRSVLEGAAERTALEAFRGQYRLAELRRASEAEWERMDYLLLPTTPSTWSIAEIEKDPIELNTRLGRYTNFVNLLDLAAIALPAGFRRDGLPLGVTLLGPAFSDRELLEWGNRFSSARA
jgi:allophanate hydrolase